MRRALWTFVLVATALTAYIFSAAATARTTTLPPDVWARPGSPPLSDRAAARLVIHQPELRPQNVKANDYVPTNAELNAFYHARTAQGQSILAETPEYRYVTGRPGLRNPSTDDLIQWAARKWGIPTDLFRAQMYFESLDIQGLQYDQAAVSPRAYWQYPRQSRIQPYQVYESIGISQIKWKPFNQLNPGANPLRWKSTAFALDYAAATIRYYYDGHCSWCGRGYHRGEGWQSIGAYNAPTPWLNNAKRDWYIQEVQATLSSRPWVPSPSTPSP
jgi:hypothetical protein